MALPDARNDREYQAFTLDSNGDVALNLATISGGVGTLPADLDDRWYQCFTTDGSGNVAFRAVISGSGVGVTTTGSPAIHQLSVFSGASTITGLAVGATGTVLAGVTGADPAFTATPSGLTSLSAASLTATSGLTLTGATVTGAPTWSSGQTFPTLSTPGQITSTLATGTAPLVIASTTNVANLNASSLNGATFAAPGAIGGGTPSTAAFTTISASGQLTSTVSTGTAPLVIASTTQVTNLNVSQLEGKTWEVPGTLGSTTPSTASVTGLQTHTVTKVFADSGYTATSGDSLILVNASGGVTSIVIPAAASHPGRLLTVKKIDSSVNAVTLDRTGADTIDGATSIGMSTQYQSTTIQSDGSLWYIL